MSKLLLDCLKGGLQGNKNEFHSHLQTYGIRTKDH